MERLTILATKPLIQMGGISITVFNVLQFVILLMVIRWAAKWSREFAYRFIFAKYKDKGLRNSMAVFTQYATIMLGAFVILKVIGIDLTTLTVVLGALAVGIGFGLQSIANNMVSGILLLIERPFRAGDIITLGAHEGEVTHIGVRATTIKTWDNMDVIIPNAETVSQALTNWTHHDSIVRTTLDINIDYSENPYQAQAIIMQVLRRHAAVVSFPDPSVLLTDFAVYSLKFQVRYFIDLSLGKSRAEVRSEVLFAIWDSLRASGIEIPFPHQSVEIVKSS
jgi:potassium efflux system protein